MPAHAIDGHALLQLRLRIVGTDAIRAFWQSSFDSGLSHIDKTPIEIVVSGDLAVETSRYTITFDDEEVPGKDTLVRQRGEDDRWQITSDIWATDG